MSVERVVVNFGCPRSGTTFMRQALGNLRKSFVTKLTENDGFHPCQGSERGLVDLTRWFGRRKKFILIRTVRHPLEVVESFAFARSPRMEKRTPGLHRNTDESVIRWIRSESDGVHIQRNGLNHWFGRQDSTLFLEIVYEKLEADSYRKSLASKLDGIMGLGEGARFLQGLRLFGKTPARTGRLSEGVGSVLSEERREWYREQLADIITREGYSA